MDFKKFLLIVFFIPCIAFAGKNEELDHFLNKLKYIPLANDFNNKHIAREFTKAQKNSHHFFLSNTEYRAFNCSFFDAWSNILNLNEEQRAHYFVLLISANPIAYSPTGEFAENTFRGTPMRIYNLMEQYIDFVELNSDTEKESCLFNLIVNYATSQNIFPIRFIRDDSRVDYALDLGYVPELEKLFLKFKNQSTIQQIPLPQASKSSKSKTNFSFSDIENTPENVLTPKKNGAILFGVEDKGQIKRYRGYYSASSINTLIYNADQLESLGVQFLKKGITLCIQQGENLFEKKELAMLPFDFFKNPQEVNKKRDMDDPRSFITNGRVGKIFCREMGLDNDDCVEFIKLNNFSQILSKSLSISSEEKTNILMSLFDNCEAIEVNLKHFPFKVDIRFGMLSALKFFGIFIDLNRQKLLGDPVVIDRMRENIAYQILNRPFFEVDNINLRWGWQTQKLFLNLMKILRKKNSPFNFGEKFPLEFHSSLEESILWFVEEDYTINEEKHKLLIPYIVLCDHALLKIKQALEPSLHSRKNPQPSFALPRGIIFTENGGVIDNRGGMIYCNNVNDFSIQPSEPNNTIFIADACGTIYLKDPHKEIDQPSSEENNNVLIADAFGTIYLQDPHKETELPK